MIEPGESKNESALRAAGRIRKRQADLSGPDLLLEAIRNGDRAKLGSAITLLESNLESDRILARELLALALPYSGNSVRLGITGVPGVGKSTFIESLGMNLVQTGKKLAVLAIDPSSQKSRGSILGDKTRMEQLSASLHAFIRPSPASDALGGVARKTREAIILCEAAGYDVIFVETVGVGQSEIAVHSMVDCFLLLMLAGAGDELQGIKRGIMEMADLISITKADGANVAASEKARRSLANAIHLFPPTEWGWIPKVLTCSAYEGKGIREIWAEVEQFIDHMKLKNGFEARRQKQDLAWFQATVKDDLWERFIREPEIAAEYSKLEQQVLDKKMTPFAAASMLWDARRK